MHAGPRPRRLVAVPLLAAATAALVVLTALSVLPWTARAMSADTGFVPLAGGAALVAFVAIMAIVLALFGRALRSGHVRYFAFAGLPLAAGLVSLAGVGGLVAGILVAAATLRVWLLGGLSTGPAHGVASPGNS